MNTKLILPIVLIIIAVTMWFNSNKPQLENFANPSNDIIAELTKDYQTFFGVNRDNIPFLTSKIEKINKKKATIEVDIKKITEYLEEHKQNIKWLEKVNAPVSTIKPIYTQKDLDQLSSQIKEYQLLQTNLIDTYSEFSSTYFPVLIYYLYQTENNQDQSSIEKYRTLKSKINQISTKIAS